jgi:hypothetical protein
VAGENLADDQTLDRERLGHAAARQGVNDRSGHAEIGEGRWGHG